MEQGEGAIGTSAQGVRFDTEPHPLHGVKGWGVSLDLP